MDIDFVWKVRDFRTHTIIGEIDSSCSLIRIPKEGLMAEFLVDYKALENPDMGQAVEIFSPVTDKVTSFVILYDFRPYVVLDGDQTSIYYVSIFKISNIDMLALVHTIHEKERKVDTK